MKTFTEHEHLMLIKGAQYPWATKEEADFLGYMAGLAAAQEAVTDEEYRRASQLMGFNLHLETPILLRK